MEPVPATHVMSILDTKTRKSKHLPLHADTLGSRLQLMIYRRLLSEMTSRSDPLDLRLFFECLHLDTDLPFSDEYVNDYRKFVIDNDLPSTFCNVNRLGMIIEPFQQTVIELTSPSRGEVSPSLKIVYRQREGHNAVVKQHKATISMTSSTTNLTPEKSPSPIPIRLESTSINSSSLTKSQESVDVALRRHESTESELSDLAERSGDDTHLIGTATKRKLRESLLILCTLWYSTGLIIKPQLRKFLWLISKWKPLFEILFWERRNSCIRKMF